MINNKNTISIFPISINFKNNIFYISLNSIKFT